MVTLLLLLISILEPNPVRYAGYGIEGEPVVPDDDPGRVLSDVGATYTFTDLGESKTYPCKGKDNRYFIVTGDTVELACGDGPVETFAPEPLHCDAVGADPNRCIEPGYDEFDPEGPQPGPPGAGTVDRPG